MIWKKLILILMCGTLFFSPLASAQSGGAGKEFIMSCTYGILTGTLVGFASLAFTDQPGENLNRVARGASLGLYLGIGLGAYVVYMVPSQDEEENSILQQPGYPTEEEGGYDDGAKYYFNLLPMISKNGIDGIAGQLHIVSF